MGFPNRQGKLGLRNALGGLILSIFERSLVFKVNTQNEFHLRLFQAGELRERVRNISEFRDRLRADVRTSVLSTPIPKDNHDAKYLLRPARLAIVRASSSGSAGFERCF